MSRSTAGARAVGHRRHEGHAHAPSLSQVWLPARAAARVASLAGSLVAWGTQRSFPVLCTRSIHIWHEHRFNSGIYMKVRLNKYPPYKSVTETMMTQKKTKISTAQLNCRAPSVRRCSESEQRRRGAWRQDEVEPRSFRYALYNRRVLRASSETDPLPQSHHSASSARTACNPPRRHPRASISAHGFRSLPSGPMTPLVSTTLP
jgi:hypothetical protein